MLEMYFHAASLSYNYGHLQTEVTDLRPGLTPNNKEGSVLISRRI